LNIGVRRPKQYTGTQQRYNNGRHYDGAKTIFHYITSSIIKKLYLHCLKSLYFGAYIFPNNHQRGDQKLRLRAGLKQHKH